MRMVPTMSVPARHEIKSLAKVIGLLLLLAQSLVHAEIATDCTGGCANANSFLTVDQVNRILAQAYQEAKAGGNQAVTIAVVDRVGNVLGLFESTAAQQQAQAAGLPPAVGGLVVIRSNRFNSDLPPLNSLTTLLQTYNIVTPTPPATPPPYTPAPTPYTAKGQGLEEAQVPSSIAAISKALTGAYLSSEGNAFSTYTAAQIIQEHFNPNVLGQAAGPLFGVQFSQLPCGDLVSQGSDLGVGPRRSPLGFSGQRGGLPLYLRGTPVGGIGVIATKVYTIEQNISNPAPSADERIAIAGATGFLAPFNRRADVITVNGQTLRFTSTGDQDLLTNPAKAPSLSTITANGEGALLSVPGYFDGTVRAGLAFGQADSGIYPADKDPASAVLFKGLNAYILSDSTGQNRYPPKDGTVTHGEQLTQGDVTTLLRKAIGVANEARSQIRRPLSTAARLTVSVVDTEGNILGILRSQDSPMFSTDVGLQKARTAAFFSNRDAGSLLQPSNVYPYVERARNFIPFATSGPLFSDGTALTPRALGNIGRPLLPDGISRTPYAPLSLPYQPVSVYKTGVNQWSEFNVGMQLDLVFSDLLYAITNPFGVALTPPYPVVPITNCAASNSSIPPNALANGMQPFAGAVPLYKNNVLVGAIGESGDGVDQDDMAGFLGAYRAGLITQPKVTNANGFIRSNRVIFNTGHASLALRFVECPFRPFINNSTESACNGK